MDDDAADCMLSFSPSSFVWFRRITFPHVPGYWRKGSGEVLYAVHKSMICRFNFLLRSPDLTYNPIMDSLTTIIALVAVVGALMPPYTPDPYASLLGQFRAVTNGTNLEVDLGYERYQGVANETTGLDTWLG